MKMLLLKYIKSLSRYFFFFIILSIFSIVLRGTMITPRRLKNYNLWKIKDLGGWMPHEMKYILIWSKGGPEWDSLKDRQDAFQENNCPYRNCFVTKDRNFFGEDYTKFDAILINGKGASEKGYELPTKRKDNQLFIFATKDSASIYPICNKKFDGYFNLTWTYRLDSDVPWTYFSIYDLEDNIIGPKVNIKWPNEFYPPPEIVETLVHDKRVPVLWVVTKCHTKSRREFLASKIDEMFRKYDFEVEHVGKCGGTKCEEEDCFKDLKRYSFYLAFEDSLSDDYVTDEILKAFQNYAVPVVFGGADYSRFLPPNSYIDAGKLDADSTAFKMASLIRNQSEYLNYFRWYSHYYYTQNDYSVCQLCEILNKDIKKVYKDFRNWWNPKSLKSYLRKPTFNVCSRLRFEH